MKIYGILVAVICSLSTQDILAGNENHDTLRTGDRAPSLTIDQWLKGKPVTQFEKGKVYILDFMSNGCGPCKAMMPHLSQLAKQYKGKAVFISIFNDDKPALPYIHKFLDKMGNKINYSIGFANPRRGSGNIYTGKLWTDWMLRSGSNPSFPTFFLVDQNGILRYKGGHQYIEDAVAELVNGTFKADFIVRKQNGFRERMTIIGDAIGNDRNVPLALQIVDSFIATKPASELDFYGMKYKLMAKSDPQTAANYVRDVIRRLFGTPNSDNGLSLTYFVTSIYRSGHGYPKYVEKPDFDFCFEIFDHCLKTYDETYHPMLYFEMAEACLYSGNAGQAMVYLNKMEKILREKGDKESIEQMDSYKKTFEFVKLNLERKSM